MHQSDIKAVSKIHRQQFPRQRNSEQWVSCNFAAFPRIMMYVARDKKDRVVGYIQWCHKSGFRNDSVIELEQIAVEESYQGEGIGTNLINQSLKYVKNFLSDTGSALKAIIVTTRTDNIAQKLYQKTLRANVIATIENLYSHDEVIMMAREQ